MAPPNQEQVLAALAGIEDPDLHRDVVSLGMIKDLEIAADGHVNFTFELTTPACPVRDRFQSMAREIVESLPGVTGVELKMTANVRQAFAGRPRGEMIPGVKQTIAIASGKGGVGKSTVAVNLAAALKLTGATVGLLDADIYGPSIPAMMGIDDEPKVVDQKMVPLQAYGMKLMSIGFLSAGKAMIWRGPMVAQAIEQLLTDVRWGDLDYLVIDLPPGTGDASLTLAQAVPLTGVAIVCTPQDVALDIAVKALQLFQSLRVTPLGLIENMSFFVCDGCLKEHHIFDHGGAERAAQRLGVPYLGAIPLEQGIREEADAGDPVVISRPDSPGAEALRQVASALAAQISIHSYHELPVINVR